MKIRIVKCLAVTVMSLMLTGCFTGVESTPKITMRDVKRQKVEITPEQKFGQEFASQSFSDWQIGKLFYVTNDRISYVLSPVDVAERLSPGDTLRYIGSREVPSLTDRPDTDLMFMTSSTDTVTYRMNATEADLKERASIEIPFTIEMSIVDRARKAMKDHEYYIMTPVWYDRAGDSRVGRKFIKVKVIDVEAGNDNYPLCIRFSDGIADDHRVFMSIGSGRRATRNFDTLFAFNDPRKNYPSITDEVWELITRSDVTTEMTRDECRLSLGAPREITRAHYMERWGYDNGVYLIFDEGFLTRYRK